MENDNLGNSGGQEFTAEKQETISTNQSGNENAEFQQQSSSFDIPEEYKMKDWAKNFEGQSGDELKAGIFKALDEKYSNIPLIPENAEGYFFNDILMDENGELLYEYPPEALGFFGDKFKELGISKEQGQGLLKTYTDFEIQEFQKYTNADDLNNSINAMFNGNQQQRREVESLIREFLPQEDQAFLQKTAPNYTIEMFYKLAQGLVNKYGFKEGTNNSNNSASMRRTQADIDNEYNRIASELEALQHRPHTTEEKSKLMAQLMNLGK